MATDTRTRYYTTARIGPKRSFTPEGYLLCEDVPLCRTGLMLYGPDETPIAARGGVAKVWRRPEDVFHPDHMRSIEGKSVVNDHPSSGEVTPETWQELTVGVILNPRRGKGVDDDLLLGDLLITQAEAIRAVNEEDKREVSMGYDAEYVESGPGEGYQKDIICNHVALVESGRCGARCSIGDHLPQQLRLKGDKKVKTNWKKIQDSIAKLKRAYVANDMAELKKAFDDMPDDMPTGDSEEETEKKVGDTHNIHISMAPAKDDAEKGEGRMKWGDEAIEAKFGEHEKKINDCMARLGDHSYSRDSEEEKKKEEEKEKEKEADKAKDAEREIEGELEEEAPEGTGDMARKANDSSFLVESYQDTVSLAEIISPGIAIFTLDQAAKPKATYDSICDLRRRALDEGLKDADTAAIIRSVRGRTLDSARLGKMFCGQVRSLFLAVGAMKQEANDRAVAGRTTTNDSLRSVPVKSSINSPIELNKRNREFYK